MCPYLVTFQIIWSSFSNLGTVTNLNSNVAQGFFGIFPYVRIPVVTISTFEWETSRCGKKMAFFIDFRLYYVGKGTWEHCFMGLNFLLDRTLLFEARWDTALRYCIRVFTGKKGFNIF